MNSLYVNLCLALRRSICMPKCTNEYYTYNVGNMQNFIIFYFDLGQNHMK